MGDLGIGGLGISIGFHHCPIINIVTIINIVIIIIVTIINIVVIINISIIIIVTTINIVIIITSSGINCSLIIINIAEGKFFLVLLLKKTIRQTGLICCRWRIPSETRSTSCSRYWNKQPSFVG